MTIADLWKTVRDYAVLSFTFWRRKARNCGITLSLREASPRVRYALLTGYEVEDARLCKTFLTAHDRVLEVGSAIGFLALYCMKRIGVRHYAMVEANPELISVLKKTSHLTTLLCRNYLMWPLIQKIVWLASDCIETTLPPTSVLIFLPIKERERSTSSNEPSHLSSTSSVLIRMCSSWISKEVKLQYKFRILPIREDYRRVSRTLCWSASDKSYY